MCFRTHGFLGVKLVVSVCLSCLCYSAKPSGVSEEHILGVTLCHSASVALRGEFKDVPVSKHDSHTQLLLTIVILKHL